MGEDFSFGREHNIVCTEFGYEKRAPLDELLWGEPARQQLKTLREEFFSSKRCSFNHQHQTQLSFRFLVGDVMLTKAEVIARIIVYFVE